MMEVTEQHLPRQLPSPSHPKAAIPWPPPCQPSHLPQDTHRLSLITTYYPGLHSLKQILRVGFHILSSDPSTQDLLTKPPSVTFKNLPTSANSLWTLISAPTGSQSCNRSQCKTGPIHHPANSFTSSCTNLNYPITTLGDCKSMNLIYQLQFTVCNAFYIGESCHSLSDRMNGYHFTTTVSNPDLSVSNPTKSLSRNAGLLVSYINCQTPPLTTFAASLKQHTNLSSNHVTPLVSTSVNPPSSTLAPAALTIFVSLFYSTAEAGNSI